MSDFDWSEFVDHSVVVSFNEIGDSVVGTVVGIEKRQGRGENPVAVVTLKDKDGEEREIWCGAADLRSKMAAVAPQKDDRIKVTFVEARQVGQPSPMKIFTVEIKRAEKQPEPEYSEEPF